MNTELIKLKIKTLSNLFIGGAPAPFEIGGVDMYTIVDANMRPYIPASSFKGALRAIIHENTDEVSKEIAALYRKYLEVERASNKARIEGLIKERESFDRTMERYDKVIQASNAEYLFGVEDFNNTPKLVFTDFWLPDNFQNSKDYFSIDAKNSIAETAERPASDPRIYKAARNGLVFTGEILFSRIELLGENALDLCRKYLIDNVTKFNDGIHRLGNSKSRGYGKIEVTVLGDR